MKDLSKMSREELLEWLKELRQHRKFTPKKARSKVPSLYREVSDELALKILKELGLEGKEAS